MTEAEWLTCDDAEKILPYLRGKASQRKLRLFAVTCCDSISDAIIDERSKQAVRVAERFADGLATQSERREMYHSLRTYADDFAPDEAAASAVSHQALVAARRAAAWTHIAVGAAADYESSATDRIPVIEHARSLERVRQARTLREIFGNPFQPLVFNQAWRTTDVMLLASGVYAEKAFDRMAILADALQDAGCDSDELLNHLRDTAAPHVRGCWALDLVLGKE